MSAEREVRFWGCDNDREELTCASIEDAIEEWQDSQDRPLPENVTVYGYSPMELPSAERIADDLLERLYEEFSDNEYGNPDGPDDEPSPTLKAAALTFAEVFRKEYVVWACEQVVAQQVKVADYWEERE